VTLIILSACGYSGVSIFAGDGLFYFVIEVDVKVTVEANSAAVLAFTHSCIP
jgi:hypothetical protein